MTADEIRGVNSKYLSELEKLVDPKVAAVQAAMFGVAIGVLTEIAAQLAEIKDILRASAPGNRMEP